MKPYLTIILVIIGCLAQPQLDISKTRTLSTVYFNAEVPDDAVEGEVLSLHHQDSTIVIRSHWPFDPNVLGVVVKDSAGELKIAVGGEVKVIVDDYFDSIPAGEWVVASGIPGRAMPIDHDYPLKAVVLGITLEPWKNGESEPSVKIMLTPGERISTRRHQSMPQKQ